MSRLFLPLLGLPWSDSGWNQHLRVTPLIRRADTNAIFDLIAALSLEHRLLLHSFMETVRGTCIMRLLMSGR